MHSFPIDLFVDMLSFYTIHMCYHIWPFSVDSYLSGICNQLEPLYSDVCMLCRHPLITRTLARRNRMMNMLPSRKAALKLHHLFTPLRHFPPHSHDNHLFCALLLSGFFTLHHLSELVWPDDTDLQSWWKVIPRASVTVTASSYGYMLPEHKADRLFAGSNILISNTFAPAGIVPSAIFNKYLSSHNSLFSMQPMLWLTECGQVPTCRWLLSCLHDVIPDSDIMGHSLCAGGVTFFASIGWPDDCIQALGCWSSQAFWIYIPTHPIVMQALPHCCNPVYGISSHHYPSSS
ncbi:uncharacterized protein PHACADRAFT_82064 [Phanerochaete carnosa HHB-10118-sp]|uniref:Uncharacterized protein n=1 Tax=Phanerochaete carnosa (strain HHB-10118-sp) TaxID=650164 RepID=K5WMU4_PHACS|nr:uncharacterized protein PHACADRAFT_82064 [Phanerochaete carnosa HHB-10118-sp]EKM60529.1 hypothetical protein PHACADRAFT_82064 [Phanerochaete carnosa HHB-10118-sp]